ncbi:hypothetical protein ScPMuIL_007115 [Solemya velum]
MAGLPPGVSCVVLDCGSGTTKAGFAQNRAPSLVFPSIVGRPRIQVAVPESEKISTYVGRGALERRGVLTYKYPIECGCVTNWDDAELLWLHAFEELGVSPEEHALLLSEPPLNPKANREKMAQLVFENLNCPAFYLANHATLAVYASGQLTGMVLESGDGATYPVPVYEGHALHHAILKVLTSGRAMTYFLSRLLIDKGYDFQTTAEMRIAENIKEKLCYVATDFKNEQEMTRKTPSMMEKRYQLPDGQTISVGRERFLCAEAFFDPTVMGDEMPGIHETMVNSIRRCCGDIRPTLYSNIVLSGGNTMFPGLGVRLEKEINRLVPDVNGIRVNSHPGRNHFTFLGGCIIACSSMFEKMVITKDDYDEYGPILVHRKCF